ncbi:MAG: hypothetical protein HYT87_15670 [Nitrospirae bacterium]|nr:hypothetical protein [Nitrospirota bacterium]
MNASDDEHTAELTRELLAKKGYTIKGVGRAKKVQGKTKILCKPMHVWTCKDLKEGLLEESDSVEQLPSESRYEILIVVGNDLARELERASRRPTRRGFRSRRRRTDAFGRGLESTIATITGGVAIGLLDETAKLESFSQGKVVASISEKIGTGPVMGADFLASIGDHVAGGLTFLYLPTDVEATAKSGTAIEASGSNNLKLFGYLGTIYLGRLEPPAIGGITLSFGGTSLFPAESGNSTVLSGSAGVVLGLIAADTIGIVLGGRMYILAPYADSKEISFEVLGDKSKYQWEGSAVFLPQLFGGLVYVYNPR